MRRLFLPSCVLLGACLVCLGVSLFSITWISPNSAHRVVLSRGALHVWWGTPGSWSAFRAPYGLDLHGWSGRPVWAPVVERSKRVWVQSAPIPAGSTAPVPFKPIYGVSAVLPWYLVLLAPAAGAGLSFRAWRRNRRMRAGLCGSCGYDVAGIRERCPECGSAIARLLSALRSIFTRAARA
jgi:hypothetical protein